jgi:hypothetical protein
MIQKLAILIGGLGAAAIFALALGAGGLISAVPAAQVQPAEASNLSAQVEATAPPTAAPSPKEETVTDTVYVAPVPSAPVIHVNHAPKTSTATNPPTRRTRTTAAPAGGEPEYEGGDSSESEGGSGTYNGGGENGGGGDD